MDNNTADIEKQLQEQVALTQQLKQQLAAIESVAKQKMSREAITRYGNIKVAHPEIATKLLVSIVQAIQQGYITEKINDERLKEILREIQSHKKDFRIIRK